jgi:hypothetical protein
MRNLEIQNKQVTVEMSMGWKGYGQYNIIAEVRIENEKHKYTFHSTDSELYDNRNDDEIDYEQWQEMLYNRVDTDLIERIEETIWNNENE